MPRHRAERLLRAIPLPTDDSRLPLRAHERYRRFAGVVSDVNGAEGGGGVSVLLRSSLGAVAAASELTSCALGPAFEMPRTRDVESGRRLYARVFQVSPSKLRANAPSSLQLTAGTTSAAKPSLDDGQLARLPTA